MSLWFNPSALGTRNSALELAIGQPRRSFGEVEQEVLYWYDVHGDRYLATDEQAEQERLRAEQERLAREQLIDRLRARGINPEDFLE